MKVDLSVLIPSIRPQNLPKVYASIAKACSKFSFELVTPSPYLMPEEMMKKPNFKYLHTYANPNVASQMAMTMCEGEFVYNTTDDGLVLGESLNEAIELFRRSMNPIDIINMRYNEGVLSVDTLELLGPPPEPASIDAWYAWSHPSLRLPGIQRHWKLALNYFMPVNTFLMLGGYDCGFEYLNHSTHDLVFRMQALGGKVIDSPSVAFWSSHLPGPVGDHQPVHDAHVVDTMKFNSIYGQADATQYRISIPYANWKAYPNVWTRRFDPNNLPLHP